MNHGALRPRLIGLVGHDLLQIDRLEALEGCARVFLHLQLGLREDGRRIILLETGVELGEGLFSPLRRVGVHQNVGDALLASTRGDRPVHDAAENERDDAHRDSEPHVAEDERDEPSAEQRQSEADAELLQVLGAERIGDRLLLAIVCNELFALRLELRLLAGCLCRHGVAPRSIKGPPSKDREGRLAHPAAAWPSKWDVLAQPPQPGGAVLAITHGCSSIQRNRGLKREIRSRAAWREPFAQRARSPWQRG